MKSNFPKSILLGLLIITTVVSFWNGPRTEEAPPPPPGRPGPKVVVQAQPVPNEAEGTEKWERFRRAGEEFSVEMPDAPFVFESRRSVGPSGETEPLRTFGLYSGGVVLLITSFDNPREEESYETFAAYHWPGTEPVFARGVNAGSFGGKEYSSTGEYFTSVRVFLAQSHAYLVCAMSQNSYDPRAKHFLDSFVLGGKPEGKEIRGQSPAEIVLPTAPPVVSSTPPSSGGGIGTGAGAPAEARPDEPYKMGEVTRKAIAVFKPAPGLTEGARLDEVTGTVRLRAVLTSEGTVRSISVIKGLPQGLTERSIDAARHILFFPAVKDGRAVSQYVTLEYNFNIY